MVRGVGRTEGILLAGVVLAVLAATGIQARSPGTWLLVLHALVLCYGGQYTYAETPAGEWVQHWLGTQRNNYDRFTHVIQGFVPAIAVREVLLRRTPLRPGGWVAFLTICVCLAIAASFEFVEWFSALAAGSGADDFLATQGDVWAREIWPLTVVGTLGSCWLILTGVPGRFGVFHGAIGPCPGCAARVPVGRACRPRISPDRVQHQLDVLGDR
ncbi:DUF2238 domain-containing protein [Amycolatopsis sp. cmx-11-12]|uniref:DUF2238 domain-containing protein n=1 Tax=Amycolatopsis sp. cmx-11-12 TaxID=2785795 RepID=UPI003917ED22